MNGRVSAGASTASASLFIRAQRREADALWYDGQRGKWQRKLARVVDYGRRVASGIGAAGKGKTTG
jgi:hypothetical protein